MKYFTQKESVMEILSVKDVVKLTGFSQSFIYSHFSSLGGKKIGGKLFFHKLNLEEALRDTKTVQNQKGDEVRLRNSNTGTEVQQEWIPNKEGGTVSRNRGRKEIEQEWKKLGLPSVDS